MTFKVGDKVRLLRVPEHWDSEWGAVGAVATVLYAGPDNNVRVNYNGDKFGWYWGLENIALAGAASGTHTPADLAMALELADLIAADNDDFFTFYHADAYWLRTQVITALYEGAV